MAKNPISPPDSLLGRGDIRRRGVYSPLSALKYKAHRDRPETSREYVAGELMGINESHLRMFPEVCERLKRAEEMDWSVDVVMPADNKAGCEIKNYGSFEGMYAALVEPWLGQYGDLKEVYQKFQKGEVGRDHFERQKHGGDRRSKNFQSNPVTLKRGNSKAYLEDRLNDHPEIRKRYDHGEFKTVKAAARAAGIVPPKPTKFEQIVKWLPSLTDEERAKLKEML